MFGLGDRGAMTFARPRSRRADAGGPVSPATSADSSGAAFTRVIGGRDVRVAGVCALLVLAVAVVFGQTACYTFIPFDDPEYVYENPQIQDGITAHNVAWAFTTMHAHNWHPLTWISHMVDCQLYGLWAGGHHLTSVVLHAANAVLLFLVLRQMTQQLWPSALVAAVFAIHPLRVESVAWASERKDILSGLFFLLTLWAYTIYARRPFALLRYVAVVLLFALGLMAKPMLVTLPLVLLLLDYWPLDRFSRTKARTLVMEKCALLILAAAACVLTLIAQGDVVAAASAKVPWPWRLANAAVAYASYLRQFFCPLNLAPFYPHPADKLPIGIIAASLAVLLAITAGVLAVRRKRPYLIVGWLWYLGMLFPVIGLLQVGGQAMADRYTYLPQIGVAAAMAWGLDDLRRLWAWRARATAAVSAMLLLAMALLAWLQTSYWSDGVCLWKHALACTPDNNLARTCLATALWTEGRTDEALVEYQAILKAGGADPEIACQAYYNMGLALDHAGRTKEAIGCFEQSLRLRSSKNSDAHYNLANALVLEGRRAEAIGHYEETIRQRPDDVEAHYNLAWLLATADRARGGDPGRAVALAERACQLGGRGSLVTLDVLAAAYASAGKFPEAVETSQKALQAATAAGRTSLARQYEVRLKLYRQGRAYRGPFNAQKPSS
jgi:tetratricopeptide (TPR) repeat protein